MKICLVFLFLILPFCDCYKTKDFLGCHKIPPMKGFSLQKFAGRWYRIAKSDPLIAAGFKCTVVDNKYINSTTCNVTSSIRNVWDNKQINGTGLLVQKYKNIPGIFSNYGSAHDNLTVVDTDYRTYMVFYTCLGNPEREEAGIFGRKAVMDQKTLDKAKKKLNSYGFYTQIFVAEDQLDC